MGRQSKWDEKFQRDAVELVCSSGCARCRVAADLGVSDPTLVRWMDKYSETDDVRASLSETERAELLRLRSENRKLKDRTSELVMEREILKKAEAFWVKESNNAKQYRFIDNHKAQYLITVLCRMLDVPESSYFDWGHHGRQIRADREEADAVLVEQIRAVHADSDGTYGAPRVKDELGDGGIIVSKKKVARLMSENDIQGLSGREHSMITTRRDRNASKIPDLVNRDFQPSEPNSVWYGDITYIWINNSFCYLAYCNRCLTTWKHL